MYKPEYVQENKMHWKFWHFVMETNNSDVARKPDLMLIRKKKKNLSSAEVCCPSRQQSQNKRKRKDRQILGSCLRAEKAVEYDGDCPK